jgi:putative glycosyltransferase (TIGR04348 family)
MPFSIALVCPAPPGSRQGNRVTALRWARILRRIGHRVRILEAWHGEDVELLVALHARRSAASVRAFRARHPGRPVAVALTGTDLYRDLTRSRAARRSLELADRLILLQAAGLRALPAATRRKARVIHQSVAVPRAAGVRPRRSFDVCVLAHLRAVKDPLRAAIAVRDLPARSRIRVVHLGGALEPRLAERARAEGRGNPRYRWLGERSRSAALRRLARSHGLVLSSRLEGGANAIGEAAALGVPILASRVDGNVGLLGARHPGLFRPGDARALRRLLLRAEDDPEFYGRLAGASRRIAPLFRPARELAAWRSLLGELRGRSTEGRTSGTLPNPQRRGSAGDPGVSPKVRSRWNVPERGYPVIAPSAALETSAANLARTPLR